MLAEIHLEDNYVAEAAIAYERVYDYREMNGSSNGGDINCIVKATYLNKAAYLYVYAENYDHAIINLEKAIILCSGMMGDAFGKTSYFDACIIKVFLGNIVECRSILTKYQQNNWTTNKEYKMLNEIIDAMTTSNSLSFSRAIAKYEPWQSKLLLASKK